ncbi:hypothetical protein LguiA_004875 [Lonicera macranthoides]
MSYTTCETFMSKFLNLFRWTFVYLLDHSFPKALACGPCYLSNLVQVDVARSENEVQANTDIEFQRNNEISTFVRLGHQLNSTIFSLFLLVLVSSTKQKVFRG